MVAITWINEITFKHDDDAINNELVVAEIIDEFCWSIAENTSGDEIN